MKVGDLVKADDWVHEGQSGIVVRVQDKDYCRGAYILLQRGMLTLIRVENLRVINESR